MCAQIAKMHFCVPRVMARVNEPELEAFCRSLGIEAVSPVSALVAHFRRILTESDRNGDNEEKEARL